MKPIRLTFIIVVLSGILGVSVFTYQMLKTINTTIPTEVRTNTQTGWQTYTNNEAGYAIHLPPNWTIEDLSNSVSSSVGFKSPELIAASKDVQEGPIPNGLDKLSVAVSFYPSLKDFQENLPGDTLPAVLSSDLYEDLETVEIADRTGYSVHGGGCIAECGLTFFVEHNTKIYGINFTIQDTEKVAYPHTASYILDSFRFIDPNIASQPLQTYQDKESGLTLSYPGNVLLNDDKPNFRATSYNQFLLSISKEKVSELGEDPPVFQLTTTEALLEQAALSNGEYGQNILFSPSPKPILKTQDGIFVKSFHIAGFFELCDVTLRKNGRFYHDDLQYTVSLLVDDEILMPKYPKYFAGNDPSNCGYYSWINPEIVNGDDSSRVALHEDIHNGSLTGELKQWFDQFDEVIASIHFE